MVAIGDEDGEDYKKGTIRINPSSQSVKLEGQV